VTGQKFDKMTDFRKRVDAHIGAHTKDLGQVGVFGDFTPVDIRCNKDAGMDVRYITKDGSDDAIGVFIVLSSGDGGVGIVTLARLTEREIKWGVASCTMIDIVKNTPHPFAWVPKTKREEFYSNK